MGKSPSPCESRRVRVRACVHGDAAAAADAPPPVWFAFDVRSQRMFVDVVFVARHAKEFSHPRQVVVDFGVGE